MEIKIKIEGLDQFTESIALLASALAIGKKQVDSHVAKQSKEIAEEVKKEEPKKEEVKEDPKEEVKEVETNLTIEDVRAKFMEKNSKGNTPKLKEILKKHKVKKVTDLDESQFNSVLEDLEAI